MPGQVSGTNGSVYIPGTPYAAIADLRQWDLTVVRDNYDASVFGDTWREYVIGLGGWSGVSNGFYDITNDPNGQMVLFNAMLFMAAVVLVFQVIAGGGNFEGQTHITNCAISTPVDNVITCDFSYVGNGSLNPNFA